MIKSINAGFGDPLSTSDITEMQQLQLDGCRTELSPSIIERAEAILSPFVGCGLQLLVILCVGQDIVTTSLDALAKHARNVVTKAWALGLSIDVEVYNEPNLEGLSATRVAQGSLAVYHELRDMGFVGAIYGGCVSNLNREGVQFMQNMQWKNLPADLSASVHRYAPRNNPTLSHMASRQHEMVAVIDACHGRLPAVTEFGYHTDGKGQQFSWLPDVPISTEEISAALVRDLKEYASWGIPRADVYQWRNPPSGMPGLHWGVHTFEGERLPQAYALQNVGVL